MKAWMTSLATIIVLGAAGFGFAQDQGQEKKDGGCQKSCPADKAKAASCDKARSDCCDKDGNVALPAMKYKVGDKVLCCPDEAAAIAKKDNATIKYLVKDKEYTDRMEALQAYAGALNDHFDQIMTVAYVVGDECLQCPMSAKAVADKTGKKVQYRVATFTFDDKAKADKAAELGRQAAEKVAIKTMVDGKIVEGGDSCCKPAAGAAKAVASTDQKPTGNVEYVIGETRTPCKVTAQVELAKAKISAAVAAMQKQLAGA